MLLRSLLFYNRMHTCKQNMMDAINDLKKKLESASYTAAAAKGVHEADVKKKDGVCLRAREWLCMYAHMRVCTCLYACVFCACACACACA